MQIIHRAKHRLEKADDKTINLTRGLAQALPFPDAEFDSVISTFPSDYTLIPIRYLTFIACFVMMDVLLFCPRHGLLDANLWIEPRLGCFKSQAKRQRIS